MTGWMKEKSSKQPEQLQQIDAYTYMQRRNIEEVEYPETETMPSYKGWECECREISISEFNMLVAVDEANGQKAIDEYTMQLIEEGVL